jgi:CheY-like chemotaxis protein
MNHLYIDHRRVLLIDHDTTKQTLRATILRNYEVEVHTAVSVADAASLSKMHAYDLVLLAAQLDSEEASWLSTQIRAIRPRQRIGLLVGPPDFIRELGGARKKARCTPRVSSGQAVENHDEVVLPSLTPSPQWQETIRRLVSDWYVGQNNLSGLPS